MRQNASQYTAIAIIYIMFFWSYPDGFASFNQNYAQSTIEHLKKNINNGELI
jgi:hypothetical protein